MTRALGWVTLFLIGTDLFVISPLLPVISVDLDVSAAAAGLTVTVFSLAYLIGGPTLGALADRAGHLPVLAAALVVFAGANLATGFAASLGVLLVARAVAGLAAAGITPSVYALISAAAPVGARAGWLSVVTSGLLLALTTGAPAGSLLVPVLGWHGIFFVLAGAAVAVLAAIGYRARAHPTSPAETKPRPDGAVAGDQRAAPNWRRRLRAVSVTALWALAVYGVYTYLGTILTGTLHASAGLVAAALACYGVGAVAGNLAGGRLADQHGPRRVSVASLTGLVVALAAFAAAVHIGTAAVLVVLAALGLVAYPFFAAQQARLAAAFPAAGGTLLAWNNSAMYAGILVGSAAGGRVLHAHGATILAAAAAAVAALAVAAATGPISAAERQQATTAGGPRR